MSRLRNRLERLLGPSKTAEPTSCSEPSSPDRELRHRLDRILGPGRIVDGSKVPSPPDHPPPQPFPSVDQVVPGKRVDEEDGQVFRVDWVLPGSQRHGRIAIGAVATQIMEGGRALFPEPLGEVEHPRQLAFLDTETTGLGIGAGTIPFLVGVGRWTEDGEFRVVQLFLEVLDGEAALLEVLARELEGVTCLVTYNGRNYDLPLLRNRHVLQRVDWPLDRVEHLDLLHPARTLWSGLWPDCRLTTLERELLGFTRTGDIPGAEIPPLYRDFLTNGADKRLAAVFHHNRDDIVSLAGLLGAAGKVASRPSGRGAMGVGFLHRKRGRDSAARTALQTALEEKLPPQTRLRALKELSLACKRDGAWQDALAAWREMLLLAPGDPFPVVEIAKWLEHRLKDPERALRHVEDALASGPWPDADRRELQRRRERLLRKRNRDGTPIASADPAD